MKSDSTQRNNRPADGAINRTLRVLAAVCEGGPQTLSGLSTVTGLTPPTLLRTLRLMRDEGFVVQDENRRWRATMLMWRLGCAVNESLGMNKMADRMLRQLAESVDETVVFAAFERGWLTYVAQVEPEKPVRTHIPLGGHYAALETVTGHAILAWLPLAEVEEIIASQAQPKYTVQARQTLYRELTEITRNGYASGTGDRWPGVWGAAAPVFDHRGRPIGAIGVSVPKSGVPANGGTMAAEVVSAARHLTMELGGPDGPPVSPLQPATR